MRAGLLALLGVPLLVGPAAAQNALVLSPDISIDIGSANPTTVHDEDVVADDGSGGLIASVLIGALPFDAELSAYHRDTTSGDELFSTDVTVVLPGPLTAEPRDVVKLVGGVGGVYSLAFDGSTLSVPVSARVDAVSGTPGSPDLLLSFDIDVSLPAVGAVDDEDVVLLSGGVYSLFYDGKTNGVPASLDLDALHRLPATGDLLLSFDASGTVGGVAFDDEDVLVFTPGLGSYAMHFDASLADADYPASDLVAVPEPGLFLLLASGALGLAALERVRRR